MFSPLKCFCNPNIVLQLRNGLQSTIVKSKLPVNNTRFIITRSNTHCLGDQSPLNTGTAVCEKPSKRFSTSLAAHDDVTSLSTDVLEQIDSKIKAKDLGRLFAVVHIGGHQRKITTDDIIILHMHIEADVGERIRLNKVQLVGGKDFSVVGRPVLSPKLVRVEASVLEKTLSNTVISSWYQRRKDTRKLYLRKIQFTMLRINKIELLQNEDLQ